jgi:N-terminal acetyltransferase B complex non-catalytic subunit
LQLATAAYEAAAAAQPGDRTLQDALFGAYVRDALLVKQQQAAMKIYKAQPNEKHLLLVVASLFEQARAASDAARGFSDEDAGVAAARGEPPFVGPDAGRLLGLAEAMLKRAAADEAGGGLRTQSTLMVYVRVLRAAGRCADAAALVAGPLGRTCMALETDRQRLLAELAAAAGRWPAAAAACSALLDANPDDWLAFVGAADALEAAAAARSAEATQLADWEREAAASAAIEPLRLGEAAMSAEQASAALDALAADLLRRGEAAGGARVVGRGPWLAGVERACRRLASCAAHSKDAEAAGQGLADAVFAHWRAFGDAPSCGADLAAYADALRRRAPAAAAELAKRLESAAASAECDAEGAAAAAAVPGGRVLSTEERSAAAAALRRLGAAAAVRADCGADAFGAGAAPARAWAATLAARCRRDAAAVNAGADAREATPGDAACLGAAEALATSAIPSASTSASDSAMLLLEACVVLQEGLAVSPAAPALRLALTAAMSLLCAGDAALAAWTPLAVRHVQLESMAHHAFPAALCAGAAPERLRGLLGAAGGFFGDAARDGGDATLQALRAGAADKALEFGAFARRLAASHTRAAAAAEAGLAAAAAARDATAATAAARLGGEPTPAALSAMRFGADLATQPRFMPPPVGGAWHAAVPGWWAPRGEAEWTARAAARAEEGGGAAQRRRCRAALVRRWAPAAALAQAWAIQDGAAAAELARIAARLRAAAPPGMEAALAALKLETDAAGDDALDADTVLLAVVEAAAAITAVLASESADAAMPLAAVAAARLRALGYASRSAAAACCTALRSGATVAGCALPLAGGALARTGALLRDGFGIAASAEAAWNLRVGGARGRTPRRAAAAEDEVASALKETRQAIAAAGAALSATLKPLLAVDAAAHAAPLRAALDASPVAAAGAPQHRAAVADAVAASQRDTAARLAALAASLAK